MPREQIELWLSAPRFKPYVDACAGDAELALRLYEWNAEAAAAFMELLSYLEVMLRNAIDRQFSSRSEGVLASGNQGDRLTDGGILETAGQERVDEAIRRVRDQGKEPRHDRVVAALSFGFWCALLAGRYEDLWRSHLRHAFPGGDGLRRAVRSELGSILPFRNRVAHHEAIFGWDLPKQEGRQLRVISFIDPEAGSYVASRSRVSGILESRPNLG